MKQLLHRVIATMLTLAFLALFFAARVLVYFYDETYSNCFIYGIRRLHRDGGMCLVSWSEYGPWPHIEWMPSAGGTAYTYEPLKPKREWFRGRAKTRQVPIWFRGHWTKRTAHDSIFIRRSTP